MPRIGSIQNGCTRLASASPRSYDATDPSQVHLAASALPPSRTALRSPTSIRPRARTRRAPLNRSPRAAENVAGVEMRTNAPATRSFRCVVGDDAGDAGVERKLQDDAPHGRRRLLHRAHQPRRRPVQQEADEQEREVERCSDRDRVQRLAGLHEVANQIRAADRDDQPRQDAANVPAMRRAESARRDGFTAATRSTGVALSAVERRSQRHAPTVSRFLQRRRRQPHHERHDDDLDEHRDDRLCQRKIVWRKVMMPPGTDAAVRHDVADLRLQRAGRRHLQRGRIRSSPCAQMLPMPSKARGGERAIVDASDAPRHLARQHGAENQAEAPVQPRAGEREEA